VTAAAEATVILSKARGLLFWISDGLKFFFSLALWERARVRALLIVHGILTYILFHGERKNNQRRKPIEKKNYFGGTSNYSSGYYFPRAGAAAGKDTEDWVSRSRWRFILLA
jgi:hypothetical protein